MMPRRLMLLLALLLVVSRVQADELPKVKKVELQPLAAQAKRVADALEFLGVPLADADRKALAAASDASKQIPILFTSEPAVLVKLHVKDEDGQPVTGSFIFRDSKGRVYPSPTRRLAPDFFFHAQIYRADGETVALQPGKYTVSY